MQDNHIYIDGFGFSGYRSFGPDIQRIGPCKKINLLIGTNNSGKSNILRFLDKHFIGLVKEYSIHPGELDKHIGKPSNNPKYEFALTLESCLYFKHIDVLDKEHKLEQPHYSQIHKILTSNVLSKGDSVAWFTYISYDNRIRFIEDMPQNFINANILPTYEWGSLFAVLIKSSGGNLKKDIIPSLLNRLSPLSSLADLRISFIPAIREVKKKKDNNSNNLFSGEGLIEQLAKLQNPDIGEDHLEDQFIKINKFLQEVTGNKTATIIIPNKQDKILVSINGNKLPLSHLGTGIHEVIILASAATIYNEQVLCIEEPEIHLHPLLQKKLLRYLAEKTTNQYFIATHSAHILDTPDAAIFRVSLENGCSKVELVLTDGQKSSICDELGYKASDLLQANCIIWVEGPSDRLYLNHWIASKTDEFVEGIHYSIMFYGGRLLSHLSAEDEITEDFIKLCRINRHMAILIDSDRKNAEDDINTTKHRIQREFKYPYNFVWITAGKEIENYLPSAQIEATLKEIYGPDSEIRKITDYETPIKSRKPGEKEYKTADKIRFARAITAKPADFTVLDLDKQLNGLISYIKQANSETRPATETV